MCKIMKKFIIPLIVLFLSVNIFAKKYSDIMPLNKIKPGMKGFGKTVFQGIKIEKFNVEIIGVLKGVRPKSGLILAKISGKTVDKAGVIAGMSGSPIYINNKIIGALAFSWAFSKEPIAGITPIEDMLDIWNMKKPQHLDSFNMNYFNNLYADSDDKNSNLKPIATPIMISGLSEHSINIFKKDFADFNLIPMLGGSAGNDNSLPVPKKFEPGAAVGVNLISGDLNASGIGTVTYVDKNKILIFGHPMFFAGNIDIPFSYAYIHTVLPSLYVSFKLGQSTKIAGKLYSDQLAGVAGTIGATPSMIPVSVNINFFKNIKQFHYNIIKNYNFLPMFLGMSILKSIEMTGGKGEQNTLLFKYKITFSNGKVISLSDSIASFNSGQSIRNSLMFLFSPISAVLLNQFKTVSISDIKINIKITPKIKIAEIKNIIINKKEYKPGDTVVLNIKIKPFKEKPFYKQLKIKLPFNIKNGKFPVIVSSARERQYIDYLLSPKKYVPQSFDQLIDIINSLANSTDISAWGIIRDKGLLINGQQLNHIPPSYYYMYKNSMETGASRTFVQIAENMPLDYIIVNDAIVNLKIKDSNN